MVPSLIIITFIIFATIPDPLRTTTIFEIITANRIVLHLNSLIHKIGSNFSKIFMDQLFWGFIQNTPKILEKYSENIWDGIYARKSCRSKANNLGKMQTSFLAEKLSRYLEQLSKDTALRICICLSLGIGNFRFNINFFTIWVIKGNWNNTSKIRSK